MGLTSGFIEWYRLLVSIVGVNDSCFNNQTAALMWQNDKFLQRCLRERGGGRPRVEGLRGLIAASLATRSAGSPKCRAVVSKLACRGTVSPTNGSLVTLLPTTVLLTSIFSVNHV